MRLYETVKTYSARPTVLTDQLASSLPNGPWLNGDDPQCLVNSN